MTWAFHCNLTSKEIGADGKAAYNFVASRSAMLGEHSSSEFDNKLTIVGLYGMRQGLVSIANHGWDADAVFQRYGTDFRCKDTSWISYWPEEETVSAVVVLSDERFDHLMGDLDKMLHGSTASMRLSLGQASFSQVENNRFTRRPTRDGFKNGATLFTEDEINFSFLPGERA